MLTMALKQFLAISRKSFWTNLCLLKTRSSEGCHQALSMSTAITKANSTEKLPRMTPIISIALNQQPSNNVEIHKSLQLSAFHQNNTFIDLFTNNPHKAYYVPTIYPNTLKAYEDIVTRKSPIEDNVIRTPISEPSTNILEKHAVRMLVIRRRKMRKHKLKRLRKRMKFVFEKIKMKRQIRKEQAFRTELLTQVEAADKFDAKEYVENIMYTLKNRPVPEDEAEAKEKRRIRKKLNRYQTSFIRPNFD